MIRWTSAPGLWQCSCVLRRNLRFPHLQVLMLHLKRFQQDLRGRLSKVDAFVPFDLLLDLAPFLQLSVQGDHNILGSNSERASKSAASKGQSPELPGAADVTSSSAATTAAAAQQSSQKDCNMATVAAQAKYDLHGVIVHSGSMRGGHYVAYVRRDIATGAAGAEVAEGSSDSDTAVSTPHTAHPASCSTAQWHHVSDSCVRPVTEQEVLSCQAYILMYVRR